MPIEFETIVLLVEDLEDNLYQTDAIHAFAANDQSNDDLTNIYSVVENGATDIKFYESDTPNINPQNFYRYKLMETQPALISDSKIKIFRHGFLRDEWIVMTYLIDDKIKVSSPIRINNFFQPTEYIETIEIDQNESGSASFDWSVQSYDVNAFFVEIMKNNSETVLSLTFTNDSNFQYFNLENVTLNLSETAPPDLELGDDYEFTVLDIGVDNWINSIYRQPFIAE